MDIRNTAADLDCIWIVYVNMQKQRESKQIKSSNIITRKIILNLCSVSYKTLHKDTLEKLRVATKK